jgi:peptidoglycan hydrolase CwlO-like protein
MFDQGDRLAMAQLQARVEELEKIEDANRATIRNLRGDKVRLEEENEVLRERCAVLDYALENAWKAWEEAADGVDASTGAVGEAE